MVSISVAGVLIFLAGLLGFFLAALRFDKNCDGCVTDFNEPKLSPASVNSFLADVAQEIIRARSLHPGNAHLLAALVEEVGELSKAMMENQGQKRINDEALHVACVACRIALEGDSDFVQIAPPRVYAYDPNYLDDPDSIWPDPPSRARVGA